MTATSASAATDTALSDAAFGANPGRWPLPVPTTPHQFWLHAVAAGGQGRYGIAATGLATLGRRPGTYVEKSLALSTGASLLRQLGWHTRARGLDGRALALASTPDSCADALIGLAADALGVCRFAAAERLLQRATEHIADGASVRIRVRLAWVTAELAMARGDGAAAVEPALQAAELAGPFGSARHVVKSDMVLAAAWCSAGELGRSRDVADAALDATDRLGLVPLRWAIASLLAGIGSATHSPAQVIGIRDHCADTVRRRGGQWSEH